MAAGASDGLVSFPALETSRGGFAGFCLTERRPFFYQTDQTLLRSEGDEVSSEELCLCSAMFCQFCALDSLTLQMKVLQFEAFLATRLLRNF